MLAKLKVCEEYPECKQTFKKVSKDISNKQKKSMINSKAEVYNFDKIARIYASKYKIDTPKSNDALYVTKDDKYYLIEFKNGSIKVDELYEKIYQSAIVIVDLKIVNSFEVLRKQSEYILVYNKEKLFKDDYKSESRSRLYDGVRKRAHKYAELFGITSKKLRFLHNSVYTLSVEEFVSKYSDLFEISDIKKII